MLGNLFNKINTYYKKIVPFFSIIYYILFLCLFHKAYFSIVLIIPAILLMNKKIKENKYFNEMDLLVIVFSITMAFVMEFIIFYFNELNMIIGIFVSILVTTTLAIAITIISIISSLIFKPLFKYLKLY